MVPDALPLRKLTHQNVNKETVQNAVIARNKPANSNRSEVTTAFASERVNEKCTL